MNQVEPADALMGFIETELRTSERGPIGVEEDLLAAGHIDSMGIMRLVAYVETQFGLTIPPEDVTIENFQSASKIMAYAHGRKSRGDGVA